MDAHAHPLSPGVSPHVRRASSFVGTLRPSPRVDASTRIAGAGSSDYFGRVRSNESITGNGSGLGHSHGNGNVASSSSSGHGSRLKTPDALGALDIHPSASLHSPRQRTPPTVLDGLSPDEQSVSDVRFDLMSRTELDMYLSRWPGTPSRLPPAEELGDGLETIRTPRARARARRRVPTAKADPQAHPQAGSRPSSSTPSPSPSPPPSPSPDSPLFPPSPPPTDGPEHPLRVLSRAVHELRAELGRVRSENAQLRDELEMYRSTRPKQADEAIHDDLTEALSTSLTPSIPIPLPAPMPRVPSPAPSSLSARRPSSPAPSTSSKDPREPSSSSAARWPSLWGWGKRPVRKGSIGSIVSQPLIPDDWRTGESSPAFRAIFLATRLITPDPASILVQSEPLIASLAHTLVSNARDQGIAPRDPPGRRRSHTQSQTLNPRPTPPSGDAQTLARARTRSRERSRAASISSRRSEAYDPIAATASIGRSLLSTVSYAWPAGSGSGGEVRPSLMHASSSSSKGVPTVATAGVRPSVEMASVVSDDQPPTVLLSRQNLGLLFNNNKRKMQTATRFAGSEPLTDRYGFIYDIQHASMLKDAQPAAQWPQSQRTEAERRHRSSSLLPSPARPTTGRDTTTTTVSSRGASLQPTHSDDTEPTSRMTVSSLLDQLSETHDRQQAERRAEWDRWIGRKGFEGGVGLGITIPHKNAKSKNPDEARAFARLVRGGIPLAYRPDVWAECSGAKDAQVPGEYREILAVHAEDVSPVQADIDKDVGRTLPGNVYFGGDGPGVEKLRRVLLAFAWRNPAVGYCQGMNMLAATLLLTHTDEEQAFWVLCGIIDHMLPAEYYTPSLLGSRADQLVLADLVAAHLPRLAARLGDLGIELASITFPWFLSLFTDCLPVETLFRVWDVFFLEGHEALFRTALAILKLNEGELVVCASVGDVFGLVAGMTGRLWAADRLVATQHAFRHVIKRGEIVGRVTKHLAALNEAGG